jgi:hypothetical protein
LHVLFITLVLLIGQAATTAAVTATRLDGSSHTGELRAWDDSHVTLEVADGEKRLATDELISLRWSPGPVPASSTQLDSTLVHLTDGTVLPANQFRVQGSRATMELEAALPAGKRTLSLPVQKVGIVQLQSLEPPVAEQWQEIQALDSASDVLVILKRGGKSVDYVEGALGDISADKIEFTLDGESMRLDRAKVAGLIYYRGADERAQSEPRCTLHGRSGLRANAARVVLSDGLVRLTTIADIELDWPVEDIHFADFSAGKIVYLSDVEQVTASWTPLVGLPAGADAAARYGQPRRDQSAYAGPLSLLVRADDPTAPRVQSFSKGLALRSHTEMVFRVPPGFRQLAALAGIEPAASSTGNVQLRIYGDERLLYDAQVAGDQPPQAIDLDITGIKRLKIVVEFGSNLDTGDWLNLCDARLIK